MEGMASQDGAPLQLSTGACFPHPSLCSPDGYLYEREAILEYILHQKREIARQMKVREEAEERRAQQDSFQSQLLSSRDLHCCCFAWNPVHLPLLSKYVRSISAQGARIGPPAGQGLWGTPANPALGTGDPCVP